MSGHNKWSQIVRQKGAADAKKSKLFSMMGRMIAVQSRLCNGDVNSAGLRTAIEKARKANMPVDTIERAIKKGTGAGEAAMEEVLYEAFGPGGVAIVIAGITDSRNRTSNEIKNILSDHGGSLGGPGSAMWAFTSSRNEAGDIIYSPTTQIPVEDADLEKLTALVNTLEDHDDVKTVATNAE